jgi:hypothetical protein
MLVWAVFMVLAAVGVTLAPFAEIMAALAATIFFLNENVTVFGAAALAPFLTVGGAMAFLRWRVRE